MTKIVYVVGGMYAPNGMSRVLCQKINYLAQHTDYELYVILTERPDLPYYYTLAEKVHIVNFNINFDDLDIMPIWKKIIHYRIKQQKYKKLFTDYLMHVKPDITVSAMRREINFLHSIKDGSKKIGELHFNRKSYRIFNKHYLPGFINRAITSHWQNNLIREIKKLDKFIVLTEEDKSYWNGITNIQAIPNPMIVYPDKASTCTEHKIIATGRYTEQKGFDMLIKSWKKVYQKHPDWELNIYGGGNREWYQKLADESDIGHVVHCNEAVNNIYDKYTENSIYVMSSRYEGMPLALLEAMSCGLPAVSFSCPCGPRDIITDGEDGILVNPENTDELAEKICYLIENEEKRKDMGLKAHENMRRYKEDNIMRRWKELFEEL